MKIDFQMSPAEEVSGDDARSQKTGKWLYRFAFFLFLAALLMMVAVVGLITNERAGNWGTELPARATLSVLGPLLNLVVIPMSVMLMVLGFLLFFAPSQGAGKAVAIGFGLCFMASASVLSIEGVMTDASPGWKMTHGIWCLSLMLASAAFLLPLLFERYLEGFDLNG